MARRRTAGEAQGMNDTTPSLASRVDAAIYDPFLWLGERLGMAGARRRVIAQASGATLEIGAGTGLNLRHYTDAVTRLTLTEPEPGMAARLEHRVRASGRANTEVIHAGAERLPFDDAGFDTVVSTLVLCTVPDAHAAVAELKRVLKPDGRLLFIEHVRAEGHRLARWQDRLERPWAAFASGCICNRPTVETLHAHGFTPHVHERAAWRGMPAVVRPLVIGAATPA
jgi:SAM-dependent methyltransferase